MKSMFKNLRFWKWGFWHDPKWMISSLISGGMWLVGTKLIHHYHEQISGWMLLATVALLFDSISWALNRILVWFRSPTRTRVSLSRNTVVWASFFALNTCVILLLTKGGGVSTMHTRYAMAPYGVLINPVRFHINNAVIYGQTSLKDAATVLGRRLRFQDRMA